MDALVSTLMGWLDANADYPSLDDVPLPIVRELSAGALASELRREPHDGVTPCDVGRRRHALYCRAVGPHGTILVLEAASTPGLQPGEPPRDNPVFRERLLHGLVRHVQHHTGAFTAIGCRSLAAADASRLGALYLRHHHVDDPLPQRWALMRDPGIDVRWSDGARMTGRRDRRRPRGRPHGERSSS